MPDVGRFPRSLTSLGQVFAFLGVFLDREQLDDATSYAVNFVTEELFTNLVRHNDSGGNEIEVSVERGADGIVLELSDFDVEPFDPAAVPPPDVDLPLERREPGGLGVHLVKSMVDKLAYEYSDRTLRVIAVKKLPP